MEKLNEEAAPNNNLAPVTIGTSKEIVGRKRSQEFSEEITGGREKDLDNQARNKKNPNNL